MRQPILSEDGVGIVELIISMAMTSLVIIMGFAALGSTQRTESLTDQDSQALAELRTGMQKLSRELRDSAKVYYSSTGKTIEFWIDYDRSFDQDDSERIIWEVSNVNGEGALTRRTLVDSSSVTWATHLVYADAFVYNRAPPTTTLVTISLTADVDPGSAPTGRTVQTNVRLRGAPS
jgi:hypothetical protein